MSLDKRRAFVYEGVVAGQGGPYGGGAIQLLIRVPRDVLAKGGDAPRPWLLANVFM